jgi:hypothetical protein
MFSSHRLGRGRANKKSAAAGVPGGSSITLALAAFFKRPQAEAQIGAGTKANTPSPSRQ